MGRLFHKGGKIADGERVEIEREDADALMCSERWTADGMNGAAGTVSECVARLCGRPVLAGKSIDVGRLTEVTTDDIIDRFLRSDNLRIVVDDNESEGDILTEAALDDADDLASEELAEIYLAQGLKDMAKETYRRLSLLNPEKSVYFAELIAKIDK